MITTRTITLVIIPVTMIMRNTSYNNGSNDGNYMYVIFTVKDIKKLHPAGIILSSIAF